MQLSLVKYFTIFLFWVQFQSTDLYALECPAPRSIQEIVLCQNKLLSISQPAAISAFLSVYADKATLACTKSGASAQPAHPNEGDLRCFFVFESGVTLATNILEGLNNDHLEMSEIYRGGGVFLGHMDLATPANTQDVMSSSVEQIEGTRMTCATCHDRQTTDSVSSNGFEAWPLAPIKINRTLSGTIPRNGQVKPEELDQVLKGLQVRHQCEKVPSETCRRIEMLLKAPRRLPLDL